MREHIDFVQVQHLPWEEGRLYGLENTEVRRLSWDEDTGEDSLLVSLAEGSRTVVPAVDTDIEVYVVAGHLDLAGEPFIRHDYAFFPAGNGPLEFHAETRCVVLVFRSNPPSSDAVSSAEMRLARAIPMVRLTTVKWDGDFDRFGLGPMKDGARMKVLRVDPFDGNTTYISSTFAFRHGVQAERHPIAQEFFVLSGELAGPRGVMQGGAYCYRPPMAIHAPYGSTTGALVLFRSHGGTQQTFWEEAPPFTYEVPHDPILPKRLKQFGKPWPGPTNY